jgi:outer membrane protein OmpA-like peptidoglycan-associated protein
MLRQRGRAAVLIGLVGLGLSFPASTHAANCSQAEAHYKAAQVHPPRAESLLEKAISECPSHAGALNNLAVIRESQGRLTDAQALYRQAIAAEPNGPAPYAGLGDIFMVKKNFRGAAEAYQTFLSKLQDDKLKGDPSGLVPHEANYRRRLQKARSHVSGDQALENESAPPSNQNIVTAKAITRSLTTKPKKPRYRGLGLAVRTEPSIDLQILFDFNSDGIKKESLSQIGEIAKALNSPKLQNTRILIEGHTDSAGSDQYNLTLSQRRAAAVQHMLTKRFGMDVQRSEINGLGEKAPIASNHSDAGRALNRRVTIVNLSKK